MDGCDRNVNIQVLGWVQAIVKAHSKVVRAILFKCGWKTRLLLHWIKLWNTAVFLSATGNGCQHGIPGNGKFLMCRIGKHIFSKGWGEWYERLKSFKRHSCKASYCVSLRCSYKDSVMYNAKGREIYGVCWDKVPLSTLIRSEVISLLCLGQKNTEVSQKTHG